MKKNHLGIVEYTRVFSSLINHRFFTSTSRIYNLANEAENKIDILHEDEMMKKSRHYGLLQVIGGYLRAIKNEC